MTNQEPDESLGVEQLPQDELEASPGPENEPAADQTNRVQEHEAVTTGSPELNSPESSSGRNNG